jgi:hypothetical protein
MDPRASGWDVIASGCWIWRGKPDPATGYCYWGRRDTGAQYLAHRRMYVERVGAIPPGWEVHHLCGEPRCVNPQHLKAVSAAEHRARHRAIVCKRGHLRTVKGASCPTCAKLIAALPDRRAQKKARNAAWWAALSPEQRAARNARRRGQGSPDAGGPRGNGGSPRATRLR